ncbi:MAG: hypothetical protein IPL33_04930 [Sphingobacteriales bacterium]|nr:hypothetical protein [Sphingobacteriales bacterium]
MQYNEQELPQQLIVWRRNPNATHIYDVILNDLSAFKHSYDRLECHVVIYPYSRQITANQFHIYPYEEYIKDISTGRKSAYQRIDEQTNRAFGIALGVLIVAIVAYWQPSNIFSVDSLVSVFGAYVLGKELWRDIERWLVQLTQRRQWRFQELYYRYALDQYTTLTNYAYLAKRRRYGREQVLPERMDMIEHSNSQTVRLCFDLHRWAELADNNVHLFSVHFDETHAAQHATEGGMLGLKLSFNRRRWSHTACFELFQSADGQEMGCLDEQGKWHTRRVFYRHTHLWGRWKWFARSGVSTKEAILITQE